jgi:hypothetical protein
MKFKSKRCFIALLVLSLLLIPVNKSRGTINSVTLTPANPTLLSNGLTYYLAGKQYIFTIQVTDPDASAWGDVTDVRLTISNTANIVAAINPGGTAGNRALVDPIVETGLIIDDATVTGNPYNFTVAFTIRILWTEAYTAWAAGRSVIASATTTNTLTDTKLLSYGVCTQIRILNFAQDGDAADGMVNPWHTAFNVSGTIVYDVPGATAADAIHSVGLDPGEITQTNLYRSAVDTTFNGGATDSPTFNVTAEWFASLGWATAAGNHNWTIRADMNTGGVLEVSMNSITINCDRIEVTLIEFINGGGVGPTGPIVRTNYYRNANVPGTQIRVTARMQNGLGPMVGNTYIVFRDSSVSANQFTVQIPNNMTQGIVNITYPAVPADVPDNATTALTYIPIRAYGGAYDGDAVAAEGQDDPADFQPVTHPTFYWDSNDPPGPNGTNFTSWLGQSQTALSITLNWVPLTPGGPDLDDDFYSYRIYHRAYTPLSPTPWLIVDRNTTGYSALGTIGTSSVSISGLAPITNYEYYVTAVDVFGQEVIYDIAAGGNQAYENAPNQNPNGDYDGLITTLAILLQTEITDGIDKYGESSFSADPGAGSRPVRRSAIRVVFTVFGGTDVDEVNIIAAPDPGVNLIVTGQIDPALTEGVDYYRYGCISQPPNKWVGYIPETCPLIVLGSNVKFVVEMSKGGAPPSYADHDSELEAPPGDPNNYEWNFAVIKQLQFKPWPVRILNNVITDKNPVAYPAYYLTDDAYVTIRVFNIKGKQVATILDNGFRRGGQNIKEGGWRGVNKAQRKLGVGLYYIHIRAKRARDGKVILNKFKKVVVAR